MEQEVFTKNLTIEHLKNFVGDYTTYGFDLNDEILEVAKIKLSNSNIFQCNMLDFNHKEKFDCITCLFGSISYLNNLEELNRTLKNFYDSLNDKGILILQPFLFLEDITYGNVYINEYKDEKISIIRMSKSKFIKEESMLNMNLQYLIATIKDESPIQHFSETHSMKIFSFEEFQDSLKTTGFKVNYEKFEEFRSGLFVCQK